MYSIYYKYLLNVFLYISFALLNYIHLESYSLDQKTIKIAYYEHYPPFSFIENKKLKGVFYDIANLVLGKMMGYKVIQEAFPWERAQEFVKKGTFDAHITTQTAFRDEFLLFQKGYVFKSHVFIAYSKNNLRIKEIEKIKNKSDLLKFDIIDFIGSGWTKNQFANDENIMKKIHFTSNVVNVLKMLDLNRADIHISVGVYLIKYIIKNEKLMNVVIKKIDFLTPPSIYFKLALRKDTVNAREILDNFDKNFLIAKNQGLIEEILSNKEYNAIYE